MPRTEFTRDEIYFTHLCDLSRGYAQRLIDTLSIVDADDRRIEDALDALTRATKKTIEAGQRCRLAVGKIKSPKTITKTCSPDQAA